MHKKNYVFSESREDTCLDPWKIGCVENVNSLQIMFPGPTVSMLKQLCWKIYNSQFWKHKYACVYICKFYRWMLELYRVVRSVSQIVSIDLLKPCLLKEVTKLSKFSLFKNGRMWGGSLFGFFFCFFLPLWNICSHRLWRSFQRILSWSISCPTDRKIISILRQMHFYYLIKDIYLSTSNSLKYLLLQFLLL